MFLDVSVLSMVNIDKHKYNKSSLVPSLIFKSLEGSWDQKVENLWLSI